MMAKINKHDTLPSFNGQSVSIIVGAKCHLNRFKWRIKRHYLRI